MFTCAFELEAFEHMSVDGQCTLIAALTNALAGVNLEYLAANPDTPSLYESGVSYSPPPIFGVQPWRDIPRLMIIGKGTCMALTAWRLAEIRRDHGQSYTCAPMVIAKEEANGIMFHVYVEYANGDTEDPSIALGMGAF